MMNEKVDGYHGNTLKRTRSFQGSVEETMTRIISPGGACRREETLKTGIFLCES